MDILGFINCYLRSHFRTQSPICDYILQNYRCIQHLLKFFLNRICISILKISVWLSAYFFLMINILLFHHWACMSWLILSLGICHLKYCRPQTQSIMLKKVEKCLNPLGEGIEKQGQGHHFSKCILRQIILKETEKQSVM